MRFVIVGAGALGTILAAHLVQAGQHVTCVVRGRRAEQLQRDGLVVQGLCEIRAECEIITDPSSIAHADVLIIGTKTYQTEHAVAPLTHLNPDLVFSMANGVKKTQQLARVFRNETVLGCMANVSGELLESGHVEYTRNVCLHVGARDHAVKEKTTKLAQIINEAGIICRAEENIQTIEWSKYVGWVAFMALAVITRANTADYLRNPSHARLACRLIKEMALIAEKKQITLIDQSPMPVKTIAEDTESVALQAIIGVGQEFAKHAPQHRMSSLQDLQRGATLEYADTLGYAVELAGELGIPAPTINDCYDLVAGINAINQA